MQDDGIGGVDGMGLDMAESGDHKRIGRFQLPELGSVNDLLAQLKHRLRESGVGEHSAISPANQHRDHLCKADVEDYQPIGSDVIKELIDQERSWFSDVALRQCAAVQEKRPHERRSSRSSISSRLNALSSGLAPHSVWIMLRTRSIPTASPWMPQFAI